MVAHGLPQRDVAGGRRGVRIGEELWEHTAILGARVAPGSFEGWEYRMQWRNWEGGDTWETAHTLRAAPNSAMAKEMAAARSDSPMPHSLVSEQSHVSVRIGEAIQIHAKKRHIQQKSPLKRLSW